jgi:hypothetical protein
MTTNLHEQLMDAELDLIALEAESTPRRLLQRLAHEDGRHPLLIGYHLMRAAAGLTGIAVCAFLAVPYLGDEVIRFMARVPASEVLPWVGILNGLCFVMAALAMRQAAVLRGAVSPLLPGERKRHHRLVGRVAQVQAAIELAKRTPAAPPVRLVRRAA